MALKDRLDQICREKHLSTKALANVTGLLPQNLYDIRNEKIKSITAEKASKIHAIFPEYSLIWLLTGEQAEQESGESNEQAKRIAELESELQKANERIDLLLSMLAKQQSENK